MVVRSHGSAVIGLTVPTVSHLRARLVREDEMVSISWSEVQTL